MCRAAFGDSARAAEWSDITALPLHASSSSDDDEGERVTDGGDDKEDDGAHLRAKRLAVLATSGPAFGPAFGALQSVGALTAQAVETEIGVAVGSRAAAVTTLRPLRTLLRHLLPRARSAGGNSYARFLVTHNGVQEYYGPDPRTATPMPAAQTQEDELAFELQQSMARHSLRKWSWSDDVRGASRAILQHLLPRRYVAVATLGDDSIAARLDLGTIPDPGAAAGGRDDAGHGALPSHVLCKQGSQAMSHAVPSGMQRAALISGWLRHPARVAAARLKEPQPSPPIVKPVNVSFALLLGRSVELVELWLDGELIISARHPRQHLPKAPLNASQVAAPWSSCEQLMRDAHIVASGSAILSAAHTSLRLEVWQRGQRFLFTDPAELTAQWKQGGGAGGTSSGACQTISGIDYHNGFVGKAPKAASAAACCALCAADPASCWAATLYNGVCYFKPAGGANTAAGADTVVVFPHGSAAVGWQEGGLQLAVLWGAGQGVDSALNGHPFAWPGTDVCGGSGSEGLVPADALLAALPHTAVATQAAGWACQAVEESGHQKALPHANAAKEPAVVGHDAVAAAGAHAPKQASLRTRHAKPRHSEGLVRPGRPEQRSKPGILMWGAAALIAVVWGLGKAGVSVWQVQVHDEASYTRSDTGLFDPAVRQHGAADGSIARFSA